MVVILKVLYRDKIAAAAPVHVGESEPIELTGKELVTEIG